MIPAQYGVNCTFKLALLATTNEVMVIIKPRTISMIPSTKAALACFSCKSDILFRLFQDNELKCCFINPPKGCKQFCFIEISCANKMRCL